MNALSRIVAHWGAIVTGSDMNIGDGHRSKNIHRNIDLVIINGAIDDCNVELIQARKFGIPVIGRDDLLGIIESKYPNRIAIAGTHGKSTTTAMIAEVLKAGGLNPTVHNGAHPNLTIGGDEYFVTEACEFKRSFHKLNPTVAVVTNVDLDHTDCYKDINELQEAFDKYTGKAQKVVQHTPGDVKHDLNLKVPGKHNIENANLAIKVGKHFEIEMPVIVGALENFRGVSRRFQYLGKYQGTDVVCDFAHHPTELSALIDTCDGLYGNGEYLLVFQPHTYTRTISFFDDFCRALKTTNYCILYKTYAAREKPKRGGTARDLATAIGVRCFDDAIELREYLSHVHSRFKSIILAGAGDIDKILNCDIL